TTRRLLATVRPIELSQPIAEDAAALAERRALKGADAIHLASALALDGDLVFTTWDRRLHAAARAQGLRVAPASLD
ncbi:MAG: PIN domain-containing protein, partial [Acidimicrobiales bacterium]|nr:PIN domain-containing protein [Acidimicrobiales bacterium]